MDKATLKKHLEEKPERRLKWFNEQKRIDLELELEAEKHKDVIFLSKVVDVYRNLPLKLLELFKWYEISKF